ncbi:threonine/serine exporter ThrE family protein [Dysgonomonas sp. 25]|uniref:threonine/serine ThrE exporter family protein n=1 Tax=Dysgonomonas sp. 25 TaxID=2302933 RepID=UPI0013D798E1|nr:threonine/serine exporter family protein [Dysgonomonas sp. 25]NDV69523.1 threonine/serine exporter [Dysgonomonas sp. 25]
MTPEEKIPAQRFADLLLDMGTYLMASGAHCGRITSNLGRLAATWGFDVDMNPSFKGLLITVKDQNNPANSVTSYRNAPSHNVHFAGITEISHLSWEVWDNKLSIETVEKRFTKIKGEKGYNSFIIALAVGLSCAGLCLFSMGDLYNALIAFAGASIGFLIRRKIDNLRFNSMLGIAAAAFVTTLISGAGYRLGVGIHPEAAMATAVLYLIPGVPLINTVIDLIEGYLLSALNRALFAGFVLLCIAAGMTLCITLLGINNFN